MRRRSEAPRRLRPGDPDLGVALSMIRAAFAEHDGVIDPPSSARRLTPEALAEPAELWVMGAPPVAAVILTPEPDALGVGKLAVRSDHRRKGHAGGLLSLAERRARALGLPCVVLQTRVELAGNHAAFEAMGFERAGHTSHPGFERPTSLTYRRPVPAVAPEPDPEARAAAVLALLGGLPEWFGVPENAARHAEAARANPTWLAREGRDAVGALVLTSPTDEACDLHLLAVRRDRHRRGVGLALIEAAEAHARGLGARFLTVRTPGPSASSARHAETRAACRALGFAALAELDGVWEGTPMLLMGRPIEPQEERP